MNLDAQLRNLLGQISSIRNSWGSLSSMKDGVYSDFSSCTSVGSDINEWLKFTQGELNIISPFVLALRVVGISLLFLFFLWEVNKVTVYQTGGEITLKGLTLPLIKFIVGYYLINECTTLAGDIFAANNTLMNWLSEFGTGGTNQQEVQIALRTVDLELAKSIQDTGLFDLLGLKISALLSRLVSLYATLSLIYQSISRKLEFLVRTVFLPVALGDVYSGFDSIGFRYIKKMLALAFYGVGMALVLRIGNSLAGSYALEVVKANGAAGVAGDIGALLKIALFPLAEAGLCTTIKQVTNDIFGV